MSEKREFVVNVEESVMREVEKAWYEFNATQTIIGYIMQQKDVVWENLQEYVNVADKRFTTCEMLKNKVAMSVKPEEVDLSKFNYSFDFNENTITFTEA